MRNDDLGDFFLSHHTRKERGSRCFAFFDRHICSRCLGWLSGALIAILMLTSGIFSYSGWAYLLPIPAFIDWGGRRLGLFKSNKMFAFFTGIILGISVPFFYLGAFTLNLQAYAFAIGYFVLYAIILMKQNPETVG
jgi:uncharacterized membrane protein